MPRAVVIGSGIGGSAAAMLLADAGLDVVLVEKNKRIGGSCSGYAKQGFHIDMGTHMFCRGDKGPLGEVLRRVGEPGAIDFRRTRDIAEIRSTQPDGSLVKIPVPAAAHRFPVFALRVARALRLSPGEAVRVARLFSWILAMPESEIDAWNDFTVADLIAPFGSSEGMKALFGFLLGLYFVIPYWEVSAGEALWCFKKMIGDNSLSYPKGGSIAIPEAYVGIAERRGATVRAGRGVAKVLVSEGRVTGVELEGGERIEADVVVSNSSLKTTVHALVGAEHFPETYVQRIDGLKASYIAVQAKIGLDRKLVQAGAVVGGVGEGIDLMRMGEREMRAMYDQVREGRVPPVVPIYMPVPTNFDPDLAPPGCQLLTVCALAPTTDVALEDPGAAWEEAMMRAVRAMVPGLDDHVLFVDRFSTKFIEHWIGKAHGPAISTGQVPGQVGRDRPPTWTPVRGLYVVGCGAGARGVGTELAAASAIEGTDRILADLGMNIPIRRVRRRDRYGSMARELASQPIAGLLSAHSR